MYIHHENSKKREYNARISEIENGSFTPLVFSCSGGTSPEADKFVKNLALKISEKNKDSYSCVGNFIRRRIIRFEILRCCVISRISESKSVAELEYEIKKDCYSKAHNLENY